METTRLNTHILTYTAINALKNAYEQCNDNAAKESIIFAFKAIIQLHYDLGKYSCHDKTFDREYDSDFDPSELCAAV